MHSAAKAYQTVATRTSSPRELEADLLLRAASRLQSVNDKNESEKAALSDALLYNRKLWQIFLVSVTGEDSTLPPELRQNVANLGLFVMNQTMNILADPKPGRINALININRELAAGLRGAAQAAAR